MDDDRGEMPEWKSAAKGKLRDLARKGGGFGSQRKLAAKWLGDPAKSSQVSEWCNADNPKFPETANLVKLRRLGVSLDWVLSEAEAASGSDGGEWTPGRVASLSAELTRYCAYVVGNHLHSAATKTFHHRPYTQQEFMVSAWVGQDVRGDFLNYLTSHLRKLVDRYCQRLSGHNLIEGLSYWKRRAQQAERKQKSQAKIGAR